MSSPSRRPPPFIYAPYQGTRDLWTLLERETFAATKVVSAGANTITPGQANFGVGHLGTTFGSPANVLINPNEAIRICKGSWCQCAQGAAIITLSCQSLAFAIIGSISGTFLRTYPGGYTGDVLASTGQILNLTDDEFLFGNDFNEQNPGPFNFICVADVKSTDAAAQNFTLSGLIQIERWRLTPTTRMRG